MFAGRKIFKRPELPRLEDIDAVMDTDVGKSSNSHSARARGGDIIRSLRLSLRAERETRAAILDAARNGASAEVIAAIASDPIPVEALVDAFQAEPIYKEPDAGVKRDPDHDAPRVSGR